MDRSLQTLAICLMFAIYISRTAEVALFLFRTVRSDWPVTHLLIMHVSVFTRLWSCVGLVILDTRFPVLRPYTASWLKIATIEAAIFGLAAEAELFRYFYIWDPIIWTRMVLLVVPSSGGPGCLLKSSISKQATGNKRHSNRTKYKLTLSQKMLNPWSTHLGFLVEDRLIRMKGLDGSRLLGRAVFGLSFCYGTVPERLYP